MSNTNKSTKINWIVVLTACVIFTIAVISMVGADVRENVPKVLPVGTNVRAIVLNTHGGQADPFNFNNGSEIMLVQFQDRAGNAGSEMHYVETTIDFSKPSPFVKNNIVDGVIKEARLLRYNLTEVWLMDYSRVEVAAGTYP